MYILYEEIFSSNERQVAIALALNGEASIRMRWSQRPFDAERWMLMDINGFFEVLGEKCERI